jgi:outer membrane protein OmpA-like peptidoglycan-associated protein
MSNAYQTVVSRCVLLCCLSGPLLSSGQNLSGHWVGTLLQDDRTYIFKMEVDMQQTGTHLSGQSKFIAEQGAWVIERFEGEVHGGRIEWGETSVVDYVAVPGWEWCIKKFSGAMHQQDGKLAISGDWTSSQLYDGTYHSGSCAPGRFLISKKLPVATPRRLLSTTVKKATRNGSKKPASPLPLKSTTVGNVTRTEVVTLKNVLFNQGEAVLLPTSQLALIPLVTRMQSVPSLHVRIDGHTDKIGAAAKNMVLSQQRAQTVKHYLVQKGIAASRIETVGYGDTRLVCPPPCEANRRVEIAFTP